MTIKFDESLIDELRNYNVRFIFQGNSEYANGIADFIEGLIIDRKNAELTLTASAKHSGQTVEIQAKKILKLEEQLSLLKAENVKLCSTMSNKE